MSASNMMNNIQKLFSEKIEIFSAVDFNKVSVLTGIIKIGLKVGLCYFLQLDLICIYVSICVSLLSNGSVRT
jgi:hypothetical protein